MGDESNKNANGPLLTARQAAAALAISARKLWSLTNIGDVPSVRIGRAVRYDPADLAAWIDAHKVGGTNRKIDTTGRRSKSVTV